MNNQFDPNNMNGWQQQQQNFQRMQQQFKQQNTTSKGTRLIIALLLGFLPQLFLDIFGTNTKIATNLELDPLQYGMLWVIGISIIVVSGIVAAILAKISPDIKSDVIIPVTSMSAAMLSLTVFTNIPGNDANFWMFMVAIFMAFVFYILAAIITWIILFIFMMNKMKKQFMNGENPFKAMMNPNMMNPNMNQNQNFKTAKKPQTRKQLDDDLKKQGIDVNELDKEFGTHFEPEEAQDVKGKKTSSKDQSTDENEQK